MTREEFCDIDYEPLAKKIAENITIREYINGNSRDYQRKATAEESQIIFNICCAAFGAYRYRGDCSVDSIMDVAEMTLHRFLPQSNSYDTIYIPFNKAIGRW